MATTTLNTTYTSKTDRMDIYVNAISKTVLIEQKWKYTWKNSPTTTKWTYAQKKAFHDTADGLIWKQWSNHFKLKCEGTSDFVKTYGLLEFTVNFDIKWVLSNEHWNVSVKKIPAGQFERSSVHWTNKVITLDTEDLNQMTRTRGGKAYKQHPFSHEFGHAVHSDEYRPTSLFKLDLLSRMNVGNELRKRHLDYIIIELNKMIPDTKFSISSLK